MATYEWKKSQSYNGCDSVIQVGGGPNYCDTTCDKIADSVFGVGGRYMAFTTVSNVHFLISTRCSVDIRPILWY